MLPGWIPPFGQQHPQLQFVEGDGGKEQAAGIHLIRPGDHSGIRLAGTHLAQLGNKIGIKEIHSFANAMHLAGATTPGQIAVRALNGVLERK